MKYQQINENGTANISNDITDNMYINMKELRTFENTETVTSYGFNIYKPDRDAFDNPYFRKTNRYIIIKELYGLTTNPSIRYTLEDKYTEHLI